MQDTKRNGTAKAVPFCVQIVWCFWIYSAFTLSMVLPPMPKLVIDNSSHLYYDDCINVIL